MTKRQRVRRYARTKIRERGPKILQLQGEPAQLSRGYFAHHVHSVHLESARCHRAPMESGRPVFTSAVEVPGYLSDVQQPEPLERLTRRGEGVAVDAVPPQPDFGGDRHRRRAKCPPRWLPPACRGRMQPSGAV